MCICAFEKNINHFGTISAVIGSYVFSLYTDSQQNMHTQKARTLNYDSIVLLCVSNAHMCVYSKCGLEFRVQMEMDTVNHVGLLLIPPPTQPLPLHILTFRVQTSTQMSIHSLRVKLQPAKGPAPAQRGQERTQRSRLSWLSALRLFVDVCFLLLDTFISAVSVCLGKTKMDSSTSVEVWVKREERKWESAAGMSV